MEAREDLEFQISRIKLVVGGIKEGCEIYQKINFAKEDEIILNLVDTLTKCQNFMKEVAHRSCIT